MPSFILFMSWTEKGITTVRDWPKRRDEARSYSQKIGVTIKDVYIITGDHDVMAIIEAPDADKVARFALGVGAYGNARTKIVQAWTDSEFATLVTDLPDRP